jgi:hypothetical protein
MQSQTKAFGDHKKQFNEIKVKPKMADKPKEIERKFERKVVLGRAMRILYGKSWLGPS